MKDKDKRFGRFPKIAQELAGRRLEKPGLGGAIGRTLRGYASGAIETVKLPGEVLKGKKYTPEEAVNFATSMVAMPGRGGGFGSGARFKNVPRPLHSTDAIGIGLNASEPQIAKMRNIHGLLEKRAAKLDQKAKETRKAGDYEKVANVGLKSQFYREAIEAATNTGSAGYSIKKLTPKELAKLKKQGRRLMSPEEKIKPVWDKDESVYRYEYKGIPKSIFRDPGSGWWFDAERLTPGSSTQLQYLGSTKKEAIKETTKTINEALKEAGITKFDMSIFQE